MPSTKIKTDYTVFSILHVDVTLHFEAHEYFDDPNRTVFIWYQQNSSLQTDGNKYIISSNDFQSNLVIRKMTTTDFGQYSVLVRNSYGEYMHNFELREKGKDISVCSKVETIVNTLINRI